MSVFIISSSFRKGRDGAPVLYDSDGARQYNERAWFPPRGPSQVDNDAKECVRGRGGDVSDRKDLLGMCNSNSL